jgi:AcrR family transcriptional regulator
MANHGHGRRNQEAHEAIMDATFALLRETGYLQLTIEGVAARAGVGKTTIYRWWPSKGALVMEAIQRQQVLAPTPPNTGNYRDDLRTVIRETIELLTASPLGPALSALAVDTLGDPERTKQMRQINKARRDLTLGILERAAADGALPHGVDPGLLFDVCAGTVLYRTLISREPMTEDSVDQLVDLVLPKLPI